ncbi:hypothetical protein SMKC049_29510 [Serratia marcescens]|nr:hypothetical protein SMKC049_29510 [Serratia marcescens]
MTVILSIAVVGLTVFVGLYVWLLLRFYKSCREFNAQDLPYELRNYD